MPSPAISLLLLTLLLASSPATAFPCQFAPSSLVTGKSISDEEAMRMAADDGLAWNKDKKSPSIILCSGQSFAGPCQLISENDFNICINLNDTAEVGSVKFSEGAMCAVYDSPGCIGEPTVFDKITPDASTPKHRARRVVSLFCEPVALFTALDPHQPKPNQRPFVGGLRRKRSALPREDSPLALADSPPPPPAAHPYAEARPGEVSLKPWTPPPGSLPTDNRCGDGSYYADGACMGPGGVRERADGAEMESDVKED